MALLSSPIAHQHTHTPHSTLCQFGIDMCACVVVKAECPLAFCRSVSGEQTASELQPQEKIKTSRPDRDKVALLRLSLHPSIHPAVRHLPALLFPFFITQTAGCQAFKKAQRKYLHVANRSVYFWFHLVQEINYVEETTWNESIKSGRLWFSAMWGECGRYALTARLHPAESGCQPGLLIRRLIAY